MAEGRGWWMRKGVGGEGGGLCGKVENSVPFFEAWRMSEMLKERELLKKVIGKFGD